MARTAQPTVPHRAYRHFAIVTLVLAALLALFISGENQQAAADEVEQQERQAQQQQTVAQHPQTPQLTRRERSNENRFGGGDLHQFGAPMEKPIDRGRNTVPNYDGATRTGDTTVVPGYSRAYLDSLTEQQYRQLLANLQQAGMLSPEERERNLANLSADSRQRSGAATPSEALVN